VVPRTAARDRASAASELTLDENQLRSYLEARLPQWMIPEVFTLIDAMPHTTRGKVDIKALPQARLATDKERHRYEPPRTDMEERLARIWQEILKLPRIGVHDTFLELGGNSLAGMRIINRINQVYGTRLSMQTIFTSPTIAAMTQAIQESSERP